MIENSNTISQEIYDEMIESLDYHNLCSPCGHKGSFIGHGSYGRKAKKKYDEETLRVKRVKCKICETTHALLPTAIVPYSQILLEDQLRIVECYEADSGYGEILDDNLCIDENNIRSIVRQYRKHWKQRLLSHNIQTASIKQLITHCFDAFNRQFMQISTTKNTLFLRPT